MGMKGSGAAWRPQHECTKEAKISSMEGSALLFTCTGGVFICIVKLGLFCEKVTCSLYFGPIVARVAALPPTVLVRGAHEPSWFAELLLSAGTPDPPHPGRHNTASVGSLSPQPQWLHPSVKGVIFFFLFIALLFWVADRRTLKPAGRVVGRVLF